MKAFPIFIRTTGRRVVIVGGGEQAAQNARLILKTDAELVLVAPDLESELSVPAEAGRASHVSELTAATFDGAVMASSPPAAPRWIRRHMRWPGRCAVRSTWSTGLTCAI